MKYDVITIGDAFEDVFVEPDLKVRSEKTFAGGRGICFEFGEKIPLESVQYEVGGSACNIAVGLSRLGYKTSFVTAIGEDSPAEKILNRLVDEGVNTDNIIQKDSIKTGFSVVFSIEGDRTIFSYHALKDYSVVKIKKSLSARWLVMTSLGENIEDIENRIIKEVAENNAKFAWNPGSIQIRKGASHYRHLLKCNSILFLNREEAMKFLDFPVKPQIEEVVRKLATFGSKIIVVTNGKEGALAYDGKEFFYAKADEHIKRIDATGAGDAFSSGFMASIMNHDPKVPFSGEEIQEALKWGIKNSNSVIKYVGAQKGLLSSVE